VSGWVAVYGPVDLVELLECDEQHGEDVLGFLSA
jgi:hypothetical protein